jgi:hypothetical protein
MSKKKENAVLKPPLTFTNRMKAFSHATAFPLPASSIALLTG